MSTKNVMRKSLIATAVAGAMSASMLPATANAEVSGTLDIASQYLWRGLALNSGEAMISGSLDYGHESGFYAGIWTSSESGPVEYDLYGGFAGEAGEISYDIGIVQYRYTTGGTQRANFDDTVTPPEFQSLTPNARAGTDFQEAYVGLGFGNFGFDGYFGFGKVGQTDDDVEDNYFALSYGMDKFGAVLGYYDLTSFEADIDPTAGVELEDIDPSYAHLDLSYEVYDGLTFTYSQIVSEEEDNYWDTSSQFVVAYSFSF